MKLKVQSDKKTHNVDVKAYGVSGSKRKELKSSISKLQKSGSDLKKAVKSYMAKKMR